MTDFRALCARMADELDEYRQLLLDDRSVTHRLADEARAALAQPEPEGPTHQEIQEWADACSEVPLEELDPEVHGWRRCFTSEEFGEAILAALARWGRPTPQPPADGEVAELVAELRHFLAGYQQMRGLDPEYVYVIHRGHAMEASIRISRLTRAADLLERLSPPQPISVSERLPGPGDCDAKGRCWWVYPPDWMELRKISTVADAFVAGATHWLPAHALPVPTRSENV